MNRTKRGIHVIVAEVILLSILLSSFSIVTLWSEKITKFSNNENGSFLYLFFCENKRAFLMVIKRGSMKMVSNEPVSVKTLRNGLLWTELLANQTYNLLEGDILEVIFRSEKGIVDLGNHILIYDFTDSDSVCALFFK